MSLHKAHDRKKVSFFFLHSMRRYLPLAWERFMRLQWIWRERLWFSLNMLHNFSQPMPFSHILFRAFINGTLRCAYFYVITIWIDSDTNTWFVLLMKIFHWIIGTQPHRRCAAARFALKTTKNSIDQFDCTMAIPFGRIHTNEMEWKKRKEK